MKHLSCLIVCLTVLAAARAQSSCDVLHHYDRFVRFELYREEGEPPGLFVHIVPDSSGDGCSAYANRNTRMLDYLLSNFTSSATDDLKALRLRPADTGSAAVQRAGIALLRRDSLFNGLLLELAAKSVEHRRPKDTVRMDVLLDVAVKYFSILRINGEGDYVGKVCAGLNDIRRTEPQRQPFVEAFCFSAILGHYDDGLREDFVEKVRQLYRFHLGVDPKERLFRAQGAMYLLMSNSPALRQALLADYERQKNDLPFVLVGG